MAEPYVIRDTRQIMPLRGIGGYIGFLWWNQAIANIQGYGGTRADQQMDRPRRNTLLDKLEVQQWEIEHTSRNVEIPMSGGRGAISRRRVASDFRWVAFVDLDMTITQGDPEIIVRNEEQPFVDGRLEGKPGGHYRLALRFHCGDPSWPLRRLAGNLGVPFSTNLGLYYWCDAALIETVHVVNSARGKDEQGAVVTYRVEGKGSSPLERWVEDRNTGEGLLVIED